MEVLPVALLSLWNALLLVGGSCQMSVEDEHLDASLTVQEVANRLCVYESTVRRLVASQTTDARPLHVPTFAGWHGPRFVSRNPGLWRNSDLRCQTLYAWVQENNPRAYVAERYNPQRQPKGDPDCRSDFLLHFSSQEKVERLNGRRRAELE